LLCLSPAAASTLDRPGGVRLKVSQRLGCAANNWLFYVTGCVAMTALKGKFAFTEYVRDGASPIYRVPDEYLHVQS
jgi:hypothetical protein